MSWKCSFSLRGSFATHTWLLGKVSGKKSTNGTYFRKSFEKTRHCLISSQKSCPTSQIQRKSPQQWSETSSFHHLGGQFCQDIYYAARGQVWLEANILKYEKQNLVLGWMISFVSEVLVTWIWCIKFCATDKWNNVLYDDSSSYSCMEWLGMITIYVLEEILGQVALWIKYATCVCDNDVNVDFASISLCFSDMHKHKDVIFAVWCCQIVIVRTECWILYSRLWVYVLSSLQCSIFFAHYANKHFCPISLISNK